VTESVSRPEAMKENLRVRVGAVVLALATLAAVTYGWLNFRQRSEFDLVDDGVALVGQCGRYRSMARGSRFSRGGRRHPPR